jgi:hypothetical protein
MLDYSVKVQSNAITCVHFITSHDSSVSTVTRLQGERSGVQVLAAGRDFSRIQTILTVFGTHPAPY